jgi:hypothetical protein
MRRVFGAFRASLPPPVLPLWRQGQTVNEWRELSSSSLSLVTPTYNPNSKPLNSRLDTWCGLGIDTSRNAIWSLANGGHDDWNGNEVYKFDLTANAPAWVEWLAGDSSLSSPHNAARYPSGRPSSCHTYFCNAYVPQRDRVIRFGATAAATVGNTFPAVDGWSPSVAQGVNGWDASSAYPDVTGADLTEWPVAVDPATGNVFVFMTNNSVRRWQESSNTWSEVNVGFPPASFIARPAAYDTTRDRILVWASSSGNAPYTFDPATGTFTSRTLTGAAASAVLAMTVGPGMVYVPAIDAYLVRRGRISGGTVYRVDASTFEATELSTTGGGSIPTTPDISGSPENVYGKWLYCPDYGCVIYVVGAATNVWALRVH